MSFSTQDQRLKRGIGAGEEGILGAIFCCYTSNNYLINQEFLLDGDKNR
jgi:hypothetical protein